MIRLTALSFLMAALVSQANAEGTKMWVRLELDMRGALGNELKSCILKELRSLGDIETTENVKAPVISVLAMEAKGVKGLLASYLFYSVIPDEFLDNAVKKSPKTFEYARSFRTVNSHRLATSPNVSEICKGIVSDYDVEVAEPFRQFSKWMKSQGG